MNIGLVSLQFEETATGGGGVHVMKITDQYLKDGHNVTVIAIYTDQIKNDLAFLEEKGVKYSSQIRGKLRLIRIFVKDGLKTPYEEKHKSLEFEIIKKFCDGAKVLLKKMEGELDAVHMHGHHLVPGYLAKELRGSNFKVISTLHFMESTLIGKEGVDHINEMPDALKDDLRNWESMVSYADEIVSISPGQRIEFLELIKNNNEYDITAIDNKLHLISSGVQDESILEEDLMKERINRDKDHINILFYSRLDPSKGAHFAINSLPELVKYTDKKVNLTIAGIPARGYENDLKKAKSELEEGLNCELLFFNSIATEDERNKFLDKFDLYLFPTLSEPFGITLIETAARGMFVITTDSAGPVYILRREKYEEEDWGYISDYGINVKLTDNPHENLINNILEAWKWYISNKEKVNEKIINFRNLIFEKYTWRGVVNQYIYLYKR